MEWETEHSLQVLFNSIMNQTAPLSTTNNTGIIIIVSQSIIKASTCLFVCFF